MRVSAVLTIAHRSPKPAPPKPRCCHGPAPKVTRPASVCCVKAWLERSQAEPLGDCTASTPPAGAGLKVAPFQVPQDQSVANGGASK